jgi:TetR/AcrR family transcriptional repressor of nem operon
LQDRINPVKRFVFNLLTGVSLLAFVAMAIRDRLVQTFVRLSCTFTGAVRAAQVAGEVRDDVEAEELADVLLAAWHGAMLRMKVDRCSGPLDRFRRVFLTTLLAPRKI